MTVKDVSPRPQGVEMDSDAMRNWLDIIGRRQNIDGQLTVSTVSSADETYVFSVSASKTYKATVQQIVAAVASSALNDQILIQDQQTSGTTGTGYTLGAWRTVTLNTEVIDTGNNASLAANQITLAAGSYEFDAVVNSGHSAGGNGSRIRLRNTSDGTTIVQGVQANNNVVDMTPYMSGSFTIAAQKTFEVQVYALITTAAGNALTTTEAEIYASIRLRKFS